MTGYPAVRVGVACCYPSPDEVAAFRSRVRTHYLRHGRHGLPWRMTRDPYAILVSEVMLQQTQVARVIPKYDAFLAEFPTLDALAAAPLEHVLRAWQGLGYNRRAMWLKRAAETLSERHGGQVPRDARALEALPGVGRTTAAGVLVFAFGSPAAYLETNVRAAYLHDFFPEQESVADRDILPLLGLTMDREDPREWFYALLDYGAWLKRALPNPSRRSAHHKRQSHFEGSNRQKRARLLRAVLAGPGRTAAELAADVTAGEAGAPAGLSEGHALAILEALEREGFVVRRHHGWVVAS